MTAREKLAATLATLDLPPDNAPGAKTHPARELEMLAMLEKLFALCEELDRRVALLEKA